MTEIDWSGDVVESGRPTPAERPRNVTFGDGGSERTEWEAARLMCRKPHRRRRAGKGGACPRPARFAENDIDLRWIAAQLAENYANADVHVVDGLVGLHPRCW